MRIELLDGSGDTIIATREFAAAQYGEEGVGWRIAEVQDPEPVALVPAAVTMRQARLALRRTGVLAGVDAAISALPEPDRTDAQIEWTYSNEVQRYNGFVSKIGPALGLGESHIDDLFRLAATL